MDEPKEFKPAKACQMLDLDNSKLSLDDTQNEREADTLNPISRVVVKTNVDDLFESELQYPDNFWIRRGFSPLKELRLYFIIVACQASSLGHSLAQRALKMPKLRQNFQTFGSRFQSVSIKSTNEYLRLKSLDKADDRQVRSATSYLKVCLRTLHIFNSFCSAIQPQPVIDQISSAMVEVRKHSDEEMSNGNHNVSLDDIIEISETSLSHASQLSSQSRTWPDFGTIEWQLEIWSEGLSGVNVYLKDLPWAREKVNISTPRQSPRNVEREYLQFLDNAPRLLSAAAQKLAVQPVFLSHNNSRPKKMEIRLSPSRLLLVRYKETEASASVDTSSLTVFWITALDVSDEQDVILHSIVENVEMFFETVQQMEYWKGELKWRMDETNPLGTLRDRPVVKEIKVFFPPSTRAVKTRFDSRGKLLQA